MQSFRNWGIFFPLRGRAKQRKMPGPYRGGGLYTYTIFTEFPVLAPSPELESGVLTNGVLTQAVLCTVTRSPLLTGSG